MDLLLVVAENIKLLVLGPLVIGLMALGVAFTLPQSFASRAYLNLGASGPEVQAAMQTPRVLDEVLKTHYPERELTQSVRTEFASKAIRMAPASGKKTDAGLYMLEITDSSPQKAHDVAVALIDGWLKSTTPAPDTKADLERKLKLTQESLESVNKLIERQTGEIAKVALPTLQFDVAQSGVSLLQLRSNYIDTIANIERQLEGTTRDVVFSPPTLPTEPVAPKKSLMAVLAALGSGFVLLLFVFMRQAWKNAAADPEAALKQNQLRRALGLKTH